MPITKSSASGSVQYVLKPPARAAVPWVARVVLTVQPFWNMRSIVKIAWATLLNLARKPIIFATDKFHHATNKITDQKQREDPAGLFTLCVPRPRGG